MQLIPIEIVDGTGGDAIEDHAAKNNDTYTCTAKQQSKYQVVGEKLL